MATPDSSKASYKAQLAQAIQWIRENPDESYTTAARIFKVKPDSIRMALKRGKRRRPHGGHTRILSEAQSEAIRSYCKDQWELGLGATKQMVFAAIGYLKQNEEPPRPPPSWRWFQTWLKANSSLHTIATKPIAQSRVDTHSETDVESWFEKYRITLDRYKIRKAKNIHNMDESGVRVGCPRGEDIVVPIDIKDAYTSSPENRKSLTIVEVISADGRQPPPPFIICPGKKVMESWIQPSLSGGEMIDQSDTGYTNERIAIAWLHHFIKHIEAGPAKPWKLLLLDGHITHESPEFVILAHSNHIALLEYPSHLTHILQPLDVGVFRPWKHYHNQAIHNALRNLDTEYTISSFFRDLSEIREKTMKSHTIRNSFSNSGIWPVSYKTAIKKMRQYSRAKPIENNTNSPLPMTPIPHSYSQCENGLSEWEERVPTLLSSPSRIRFENWSHGTKAQLSKAQLQERESELLGARLQEQHKARIRSRKSINSGGPLTVEAARERIKVKEKKEKQEAIRKAEKAVTNAERKAKKALKQRGVEARKAERARKKTILEMNTRGEFLPLELLTPIRDPEKNPTPEELEALQPHPSLTQALYELRPPIDPQLVDTDDEVEFQLSGGGSGGDDFEGEPSVPPDSDSDDGIESIASDESLDSIAMNADFIGFE